MTATKKQKRRTTSLTALESESWKLRHQLSELTEERRRLLMERVKAILTSQVIEASKYTYFADVIAEVLTVDSRPTPTQVQEIHHKWSLAMVAHLNDMGSFKAAHVQVLNVLRECMSASTEIIPPRPLSLWPGWHPAKGEPK